MFFLVRSKKSNRRYLFLTLLVLALVAVFLTDPKRYAKSILKGINLWAVSVLPATFPFLFLTALLFALPPFSRLMKRLSPFFEKLFRASPAGAGIAALASLSGYPVGARLLGDAFLEGRVSRDEVTHLSFLVTTSGPPFLVGTVGAIMFQSTLKGWILLLSHLLGVWTVCFVLSRFQKRKPSSTPPQPVKEVKATLLYDSLYNAVISILCVGGLIALFYCLGDMLQNFGLFSLFSDNLYIEGTIRGLLEMTSGCSVLSNIKDSALSLALSGGIVTFGGACVLMQEIAFLSHTQIPAGKFILVKFAQGVCAFLYCYVFALFL